MLRFTVAVLAFALTGIAGADESDSLRIDASSHRAFKRSLEAAKNELSPENLQRLGGALKHIWNEGARAAHAERRRYSDKDYFRQLDGLSYEEVVHFTDATYEAALREQQYRASMDSTQRAAAENKYSAARAAMPADRYRHKDIGTYNRSFRNENEPRGGTDLVGVPGQR